MQHKTKFTPGPWKVTSYGWGDKTENGTPVFKGRIFGDGQLIHSGSGFGLFGRTSEEAEANAVLIAAAPELYDALEALHESYVKACPFANLVAQQARAALAKARGEQ